MLPRPTASQRRDRIRLAPGKTTTGCVTRSSMTVNVNPNPVADFTFASQHLSARWVPPVYQLTISDGTSQFVLAMPGPSETVVPHRQPRIMHPIIPPPARIQVGLTVPNRDVRIPNQFRCPRINPEPQAHFTVNANAAWCATSFRDASTGEGGIVPNGTGISAMAASAVQNPTLCRDQELSGNAERRPRPAVLRSTILKPMQ